MKFISHGISKLAESEIGERVPLSEDEADLYYLDLLSYRQVSNEVGYTFKVIHESPQLLIIKNGQTVAHASHGAINAMEIHALV